jgi:hypothetical protein
MATPLLNPLPERRRSWFDYDIVASEHPACPRDLRCARWATRKNDRAPYDRTARGTGVRRYHR